MSGEPHDDTGAHLLVARGDEFSGSTGGQTMSKVINAVYTNGVFRPLEPVVLPEGEPVQVFVPERPPIPPERLAALDAFDTTCEELTEEQWRVFEEAARRRPWFGGRQLDR
jgi:predicted DNA-binding antitoxin AbrB/MazE fold protein